MGAIASGTAAGIGLIGTLGSTISQVKATQANESAIDSEAKNVQMQADYDITQQTRINKLINGEANATTAGSGISLSSGSPLLMELDRAKQSALQNMNLQRGATNQVNALNFAKGMLKASIPGTILGGAMQGGSILSQFVGSQAMPMRRTY